MGGGEDVRLDQQASPHHRDYERLPASHEAMILWAMIALMAHRLAQPSHLSNTHLVTFRLFVLSTLTTFKSKVVI